MFAIFSCEFQAALKIHTNNYEKYTVDRITHFYEQFKTNKVRKKAKKEYTQKSNNTRSLRIYYYLSVNFYYFLLFTLNH